MADSERHTLANGMISAEMGVKMSATDFEELMTAFALRIKDAERAGELEEGRMARGFANASRAGTAAERAELAALVDQLGVKADDDQQKTGRFVKRRRRK